MKNLAFISLILLFVSSCIKVETDYTSCPKIPKPSIDSTSITGSYGATISINVNNYSTNYRYTLTGPNNYTDTYPFNMQLIGQGMEGTYFIQASDFSSICKSEKTSFDLNLKFGMPTCSTSENVFRLSSSSTYYATALAIGENNGTYYVSKWHPNGGNLFIYFKQKPPMDGEVYQYGTGSSVNENNLSSNTCKISYVNTLGSLYTASSGNVYVQYINGKFTVKYCDVPFYNFSTGSTVSGSRAKMYFTE